MIKKEHLYANINEGVVEERIRLFQLNLDKNLHLIKIFGGLGKIIPHFINKNVIIIGAGPSLDNNIGLLKKVQYRDELVLVATDMSVRPLVRQGVKPAFVFSCETHAADFFSDIDSSRMDLVAFSCASHSNVRKWRGSVSFYNWMLNEPVYDRLWERAGRSLGFVATASIVTTQAIAFSLGTAVRSLMLVGNDLGFIDRFYAKGTIAGDAMIHGVNRLKPYESRVITGARLNREYEINRGSSVYYTNHQFLAAKMWLEELFSKAKVDIFDCSVPGCSEKYVNRMSLEKYFSTFHILRKRRRC